MIGQIDKISNVSVGKVVDYHFSKIDEGVAKIIDSNLIGDDSSMEVKKELREALMFHSKGGQLSNPFIHTSINLYPGEHLTDKQFNRVVDEYLKANDLNDNKYIVFKHDDKEHSHIHIVTTKVKNDGSLSVDNYDYRKTEEVLRKMEIRYGLESPDDHKREDRRTKSGSSYKDFREYQFSNAYIKAEKELDDISYDREIFDMLKKGVDLKSEKQLKDADLRERFLSTPNGLFKYKQMQEFLVEKGFVTLDVKQELSRILKSELDRSATQSEFIHNISKKGVSSRRIGSGMKYGYDSYFFLEDKLSKRYSVDGLKGYFGSERKKFMSKVDREEIAGMIKDNAIKSSSFGEFVDRNRLVGIETKTDANSGGIYGIQFRNSIKNTEWFKGSEIDRDLSWNKVEKLINGEDVSVKTGKDNIEDKDKDVDTPGQSKGYQNRPGSSKSILGEGVSGRDSSEREHDQNSKEEPKKKKGKKNKRGRGR